MAARGEQRRRAARWLSMQGRACRVVHWPCAGYAAHLCSACVLAGCMSAADGWVHRQAGRQGLVSAIPSRPAHASAGLQRTCWPAPHRQPRRYADALKLLCCCAQGGSALYATIGRFQGQAGAPHACVPPCLPVRTALGSWDAACGIAQSAEGALLLTCTRLTHLTCLPTCRLSLG